MRSIILSIVLIFFFIPTIAEGVDWVLVTKSDESLWFVDNKSIKVISSNIVEAWIKEVPLKSYALNNKRVTYSLSYEEYECQNKKSRILQFEYYYTDGSNVTLTIHEVESTWFYISPDSVHEDLYKYLCNNQRKELINENKN